MNVACVCDNRATTRRYEQKRPRTFQEFAKQLFLVINLPISFRTPHHSDSPISITLFCNNILFVSLMGEFRRNYASLVASQFPFPAYTINCSREIMRTNVGGGLCHKLPCNSDQKVCRECEKTVKTGAPRRRESTSQRRTIIDDEPHEPASLFNAETRRNANTVARITRQVQLHVAPSAPREARVPDSCHLSRL